MPVAHILMTTTVGAMTLELDADNAPKTVENFLSYVSNGFYDGTIFHRVINNFMVQGGDFTHFCGTGGESIYGPTFEDENFNIKHLLPGVLSMANAGPDTNGSQFFITLAPTAWLDGKHTIFGRVYSGMDVVERLGLVPTSAGDRPTTQVGILAATLTHVGAYRNDDDDGGRQ